MSLILLNSQQKILIFERDYMEYKRKFCLDLFDLPKQKFHLPQNIHTNKYFQ